MLTAVICWLSLAFPPASLQAHQDQQSQAEPQKHVTAHETVVVGAKPTKEEIEEYNAEGPIETALDKASKTYARGDIENALIQYQSVVRMAEPLKYQETRGKYLSTAYGRIGDCYFKFKRYQEAERIYQQRFEYLRIWPGILDSEYAQNYESIALVKIVQEQWHEAEGPLQQAISLLNQQIDHFKKSDDYDEQDVVANDVRGSQDTALNLLAVVCYHEGRYPDALTLLERAYLQGEKFHAPQATLKLIVDNGLEAAKAAGNLVAGAIWLKRSLLDVK